MAKLTDMKASQTRRVLVYGPPKTGKTLLVGKLAKKFNMYWLDLDIGTSVLYQLPLELQEKINIWQIPDTKDDPVAISTVLKVLRGGACKICDMHGVVNCVACAKATPPRATSLLQIGALGPDDCVVLDGLNQLTMSAISMVTAGEADEYKLVTDDWGNLKKLMDIVLGYVQACKNTNFICISHAIEKDGDPKKAATSGLIPLCGSRNTSLNVAKNFDDVVFVDVINNRHMAASSTTWRNSIKAGSRSGVQLEKQATPDLATLWG